MTTAAAQPVRYLQPESYQAAAGGQVSVRIAAGDAANAQNERWPGERVGWFFTRVAGTQVNLDHSRPAKADDDFLTLAAPQGGVMMAGLDLRPSVAEYSGAELERFFTRYVPPGALPAGRKALPDDARVRVRRVESAKLLLKVAGARGETLDASAPLSKAGQQVEIRLLADPTSAAVGSDIPVWTYVGNAKQGGVKVIATHVASKQTQESVADAGGAARFTLKQPGPWRVEFHYARPLVDDPQADWVIYTATLAFEANGVGQ